ncbi:MAG: homogentisate 1,2-dioxygenase, partial [Geminicoccaceae bacterium]
MMEPAAVHRSGRHKHVYTVTESMEDTYFYSADGEMLVVPEIGALRFFTEFGVIDIAPGEIAVLPRGVKFTVELTDDQAARGYICENYGAMFVC